MLLIRKYYPYDAWEETYSDMWKTTNNKDAMLNTAIKFTGDHKKYGSAMIKVIELWPISCEQNLLCKGMNRQAWIGHAACAIAIKCPEDIVRLAWRHLSEVQRRLANDQADYAIRIFEEKYRRGPWQRNIWE